MAPAEIVCSVQLTHGLVSVGCFRSMRKDMHKFEELTADRLTEVLNETSLVYVPIGTLEFHGVHLPLGMDTIHAYEFCLRAAEQTGGVVLPPSYWGALGHEGWTGSLLIRDETFRALVRDIFELLADQGVRLVVATTGHWPARQGVTIAELAKRAMKSRPECRILALDPFTTNPDDPEADHGGMKETSLMLSIRPDLVHMEKLSAGEEVFKGVGSNCVDGTAEYGLNYFNRSLENYIRQIKEALAETVE